jgi:cell division protein FtsB
VKSLQEVIRQESAKNAVLLSRMQALEEDIAQLQEIKVSKISL